MEVEWLSSKYKQRMHTSSGNHPSSYSMCTGGSLAGIKVAGVRSWTFTSTWCKGYERVQLCLLFPIFLHGVQRDNFILTYIYRPFFDSSPLPFLCTFAKLRKATIRFVMSGRPHEKRKKERKKEKKKLPLIGCSWNLTLSVSRKSVEKIPVSFKWHK